MTQYIYDEMQKNERFEQLVNTKEILTKEEADFIISWDPTEHENMFYLNENEFIAEGPFIYARTCMERSGMPFEPHET